LGAIKILPPLDKGHPVDRPSSGCIVGHTRTDLRQITVENVIGFVEKSVPLGILGLGSGSGSLV